MSQVGIQWMNVYGMGRHLVATTPTGPWCPCSMEGKPAGEGLPCTACTDVLHRLVDDLTDIEAAS